MLNNILLVDDDADEHLFLQWTAEKISNELCVLHAYSGGQAVKMLKQVIPDIILLDINLPGSNGFECLREIRQIKAYDHIPVYMYSTEITEEYEKMALELGASGSIKKSRTSANFIDRVAEILI